jgi:hypothetical protein
MGGVSSHRSVEDKGRMEKDANHFLLLITFVMACRMIVPDFSISFLVRPVVTQTFRAGGTTCLGSKLSSRVFRRVMRTLLARHCGKLDNRLEIGNVDRWGCNAHLVDDILEQELLVISRKPLSSNNLRLNNQDENRVLRRAGAVDPVTARIKLGAHSPGKIAELRHSLRAVLEDVDSSTSGGRQQRRKRGREGISGRGNSLVVNNLL